MLGQKLRQAVLVLSVKDIKYIFMILTITYLSYIQAHCLKDWLIILKESIPNKHQLLRPQVINRRKGKFLTNFDKIYLKNTNFI